MDKHYKYLIIGGGMTADAAVQAIRELDAEGPTAMLSMEPDPPYDRPPLTKGLWKGKPEEKIWRQTKAHPEVTLLLETRAVSIDASNKSVAAANGVTYGYDKLLLATGGRPRRLRFGGDDIIYYRTLRDYHRVRELADAKQTFALIGGGFIGSELAAALAMNGKQAVMIFPEKVINGARFPPDLGDYLNTFYRDKGVNVAAEHEVTNVEPRGETLVVTAKHRQANTTREFAVDGVIAGIGILPNIELAQAADIRVEDGIVVDEYLRTNQPDIYAAGDVAMVYRPLLGKAARIEHEDNANAMGRAAGRNMAGAQERFTYQPYFYSDLFDLGYEAVGDFSPGLEMIAEWQEPYQRGVIYYLGDGRVRGVVLWNVWERRDAARALIAEPGPFDAKNVKGRIALGK